jgi:hypothetical protein
MPQCKNDPNRSYKGTEPSPKGLGYCAHSENIGKERKGKDGNKWIVSETKSGIKRWIKKETKKETKKINKKEIIKRYNFRNNSEFTNYFEKIYKNDFEEYIENNRNILKKLSFKNVKNIDELGKQLEKKEIQKKIIKELTKTNKIPKDVINYYIKNTNNENITKEIIIECINEYLIERYNRLSILDFDIGYIYEKGKFNTLDEEGPREFIIKKLNNYKKNTFIGKLFKIF